MGKRIELTNVELYQLLQGCNLIQQKFDLVASIDFRLTKIINTIQPHFKEYQEAVQKVREKYRAEVDDEETDEENEEPKVEGADKPKDEYKVQEGKEEELQEEIKKLDEEKVEIHLPTTFHIEDFVDEDGKQLKFKDEQLGGVSYLIDPIIVV